MSKDDEGPGLFHWSNAVNTPIGEGTLCVIGVPADHGNGVSRGAALAPFQVRQAAAVLAEPRHAGFDMGDLADCASADLTTILARLSEVTESIVARGMRPLIIGGDHSITSAPVSVLQRGRDIGVIWFDAHTDFSPWKDGEVHSHKQVLRRVDAMPGVARVIQVGYRGLTAGDERHLGRKATVITAAVAQDMSADALLDHMPIDIPWYLSVDIDVVDPFHAPGTSAPVPDGLMPAKVRELLAAVVARRTVLGADVVEVNPRLDVDQRTSAIAALFLWTIADGLAPGDCCASGTPAAVNH